jgi:hypothetical protein
LRSAGGEGEDYDEEEERAYLCHYGLKRWLLTFLSAISRLFSGEEAFGRYLDLNANHIQYNNLKHLDKRVPYLQYIDLLANAKESPLHAELSKIAKGTKEYEAYVDPFPAGYQIGLTLWALTQVIYHLSTLT